ncbi:MAG: serine hydrolase domain-containing protein [Acidimicrobiia bacterium]
MATETAKPSTLRIRLLPGLFLIIVVGACGSFNQAGMPITEGAEALGEAQPERGVPPHVAPRLDAASLQALDDFVTATMLERDIPGLALGIVSGGFPIHLRGFGVADGRSRPITPDTPFLLAAPTSLLTAIATLQLVEDGVLDLDAPIRRYLPWFETASGEPASITPRLLLHHQSGFSERTAWTTSSAAMPRM